jgi:hypothetical protein
MNRINAFAAAGVVGAVFLAATVAVMHVIQPELDPATRFVSEYAHGRLGWLITIGYVAAGAGTVLLAWSVWTAVRGRRGLAAALFLAVFGLALVATGLTRIDIATASGPIVSTASGQAHELAGYVAVLGLIPAAFLLAGAFHRNAHLAGAEFAARIFSWALVAAFIVAVLSQRFDLLGVGQRIFLITWLAWLVFVGLKLLNHVEAPRQSAPIAG